MNKRTLCALIVLVFGTVLLSGLWLNRYALYDYAKLRNYTPTPQIADLATRSSMSDYGRTLFYVHDPQLSDRQEFATQCKVREETIVLGCFTGARIYVFDVQDERLNGVEEVTAAHEMLHAAYERLSPNERKRIDALTAAAYERVKDPELAKRMEGYKKTEPTEIPNELHSILATEKRNIGSELEEYYRKYFNDRLVVVSLAEEYEKALVDRPNQIQKYDADLTLRKSEIQRAELELKELKAEVDALAGQLEGYKQTNATSLYNSLVPIYNKTVNAYNVLAAKYRGLVDEYNALVAERNELAADQENLAQSLDSRLEAIKQ